MAVKAGLSALSVDEDVVAGDNSHHEAAYSQYSKPMASSGHDAAEWEATIQVVVGAVVSIRLCRPCPFDSDSATSSQATGFVVDVDRG